MKNKVDLQLEKDLDPIEYLVKSMRGGDDRYVIDMIYDLTVKLVQDMPSITQCEKEHQHTMVREILNHRIMELYHVFVYDNEE